MIEPTDEMFNAFYEAGVDRDFRLSDTRAGLAAVLAIVERDYTMRPRRPRCPKCDSVLQKCAAIGCLNRAECGEPLCTEHEPDGAS